MCMIRRDEYLICVCVCVCDVYRTMWQCTKSKTFGTFKTAPRHKIAAFQMVAVTQTLELSSKKRQLQKCLAMFLTSHHGGSALNTKHNAHSMCVQVI
jgi:hypothetical protein